MRRYYFALFFAGCLSGSHITHPDLANVPAMHGDLSGMIVDTAGDASGTVVGDMPPTDQAGAFVVVGYGARRARSLDYGVTWESDEVVEDMGGDDAELLRTVLYAGNKFVALGYHSFTSPDGKTWTDLGGLNPNQWVGAAVYVNNEYVVVGGYGERATSTDSINYDHHDLDTTAAHAHDAIVYGSGTFVAANDDGQRSHSADGVTWTYSTGSSTATTEVAYGDGAFIAIGAGKVVRSTDNGVTFSDVANLGATTSGLLYAQNRFLAIGTGNVYTSTDGSTWTKHTAAGIQSGQVAYGHGNYVVVAYHSRYHSADGLTWDAPITDNNNGFEMVAYGALP